MNNICYKVFLVNGDVIVGALNENNHSSLALSDYVIIHVASCKVKNAYIGYENSWIRINREEILSLEEITVDELTVYQTSAKDKYIRSSIQMIIEKEGLNSDKIKVVELKEDYKDSEIDRKYFGDRIKLCQVGLKSRDGVEWYKFRVIDNQGLPEFTAVPYYEPEK